MTTKKATEQMVNDLYSLILSLESPEDCRLLFEDLCTYKEIEQMSLRVRAAKLLIEGKPITRSWTKWKSPRQR